MMPRWSKIVLGVAASLCLAIGVGAAVAWAKLPQLVAGRASEATGRAVAIGALTLSPGRWIGVELRDAAIANLPGGTSPQMATLGSLTGEVELWPLLHGTIVARGVQVREADILLEKVGEQPNWRGPKQPEKPDGGRAGFPTILDAVLDGTVTFRTSGGHALVTRLNQVKLDAQAADRPARITGPASYQEAPIVLDLKLGSYDQLHDAATPFPTDITLTSGDTVLHFVGTMTKPLDADGADGHLDLLAPTPGALEKIAGIDPAPAPGLRLGGAFRHEADLWTLGQAKGALGEAALEDGTLTLREGSATPPKTPDKIDLALRFARIDAARLMAEFEGSGGGGGGGGGSGGFVPDADPNPQIAVTLEAAELSYDKLRFAKPKISLSVEPRLLRLGEASFGTLGGAVRLDGRIEAEADGKAGAASATLSGTGLDMAELRQVLGAGRLPLAGRVDIHAVAGGVGQGPAAALKAGHASVVATMQGGSVSAQLVKIASTDVTGLLTSSRTMVALDCLLAVAELRGGVAALGPLRLRSAEGTVVARGHADLFRKTLDVVVASEAGTTGLLALDVPVRVSGSFDDPSIGPAGSAAGRAALAAGTAAAPLRAYAQRSRCAR